MASYIFGMGQVAEVLHASLLFNGVLDEVDGFVVDEAYITGHTHSSKPIRPTSVISSNDEVYLGVSLKGLNRSRQDVFNRLQLVNAKLPKLVDRRANIDDGVKIGEASWIQELNNIQCYSTIGTGVILWSGNHVGHHSTIGDFSFVASHACIGGNVRIGERCFIGINSTIGDGVVIGDDCIIAAGAIVTKDVPSFSVVSPQKNEVKYFGSRIHRIL